VALAPVRSVTARGCPCTSRHEADDGRQACCRIAGATGAGSMGTLAGALIRITAAHAVPAAMWAVMEALIVVPAAVASLALILGYRQKKLEIESAAELEKARQEMYWVLLEKSAAAAAGSASYQELVYADAVHLSVERNGAQPAGLMHKSLYGRGSTGPVRQQPAPGRMMPPGQEPGPVMMSHMDPVGDTGECQPRRGRGPLMDEGGGRCLNQPARRPEPPTAGASMDDATASVPDVPAGEQKTVTSSHGPAGISKVEYAMVYQAEKPRLVRYLIQCGANSHDADDAAQRALLALYEQWSAVRNRRPWLRKVAFREFIRARAAEERPLGVRDQLHAALDHAGVESLLEQGSQRTNRRPALASVRDSS
jgi:hypothetical protein